MVNTDKEHLQAILDKARKNLVPEGAKLIGTWLNQLGPFHRPASMLSI